MEGGVEWTNESTQTITFVKSRGDDKHLFHREGGKPFSHTWSQGGVGGHFHAQVLRGFIVFFFIFIRIL